MIKVGDYSGASSSCNISSTLDNYQSYSLTDFTLVVTSIGANSHNNRPVATSTSCAPCITAYNSATGVLSLNGMSGSVNGQDQGVSCYVNKYSIYVIPK